MAKSRWLPSASATSPPELENTVPSARRSSALSPRLHATRTQRAARVRIDRIDLTRCNIRTQAPEPPVEADSITVQSDGRSLLPEPDVEHLDEHRESHGEVR